MPVSRREFLLQAGVCVIGSACSPSPIVDAPCSNPRISCTDPTPTAQGLCELYSYDELHHATATLVRPSSEAELSKLFSSLAPGRHVIVRGGGNSFDSQALGSDLAVAMTGPGWTSIGDVQLDAGGFYITTGAGAAWCDVVAKVSQLGLMPPSLVTANTATVGGTLSADCVSRMSPIAGKEGEHVRSFRMVLASGEVVECTRDDQNPSRATLFNAVIGGFGTLGAVTQVTFDLMVARSHPGILDPSQPAALSAPTVLTRSTRHGTNLVWDDVLRSLQSKTTSARTAFRATVPRFASKDGTPSPSTPQQLSSAPEWSALSIASFFAASGMSANLLEQRYSEDRTLRRTPGGTYDKDSTFVATTQNLSATMPTAVELALDFGFPDGEFIDELSGWAFFLGNACGKAKALAHQRGYRLNIIQQTFVLPVRAPGVFAGDVPDPGHIDTRPMRRFIELAQARLHAIDVRPSAIDFLYIPADTFLMSASRNLDGFAMTISLTLRDLGVLPAAINDMFCALSRDCRSLGGRVHLVKNVIADPGDLRAMHGDAAAQLRRLKQQFDPRGLFTNAFFSRVFDA